MTAIIKFPERVWYETENGKWASRAATKEDKEVRQKYIADRKNTIAG